MIAMPRGSMKITLTAVVALLLATAVPAMADGCRPVDAHFVDPAKAAGRKGWIYEDTGAIARREPARWASAAPSREVAPGKFVIDPPTLSYAQPVTIVEYDATHSMFGEYLVRLADGSIKRVEKRVVKLHEFWRCRPEVLLDSMRNGGLPRLDRRLVNVVWATIRDRKTRALEGSGNLTAEGELGRTAFLICDSYVPAVPGDTASIYDVRCQGFEPGRNKSRSYRIRHEDLETVSPVSMRMLFEG